MTERPTNAAVAKQLDRMEASLARIEEKADITNGRVTVIEHTLHGPIDRERRHLGGGLVNKVDEMEDVVAKVVSATTGHSAGQSASQKSWQTIIAGASVLIAGLSLSAVVLGLILT